MLPCFAATLALAGCGAPTPTAEPPLAGATIGGDFALTNSAGETVRWDDFAGRYPRGLFRLCLLPRYLPDRYAARGARAESPESERIPKKAARITPIFITIDPERDTARGGRRIRRGVLARHHRPHRHPRSDRRHSQGPFRVFYAKGEAVEGGGYLVDHSNIVFLFGPEGETAGDVAGRSGARTRMAVELRKWVS